MTIPPNQDAWDLDRIRQIVTQNDLERGRIEYKRELGNGRGALEAITALANTFGGVVLVGVDEDKQGLDRLTGVPAAERNRLVSMCWSQLTPPFSPEIIPIKLDHDDRHILAIVINTDYIRRPIMLNKGNKILVRLDDQNQAPDWHRLRDLFTEQAPSYQDTSLPPADPGTYTYGDVDLALRGRLLLTGPRGRPSQITGPARAAALAILKSNETPLTGPGSSLAALMSQIVPGAFGANDWHLDGHTNTRQFNACWHGLGPNGRALTQARIRVQITPRPPQGDTLLITLDALVTDPRHPTITESLDSLPDLPENEGFTDTIPKTALDALHRATTYTPTPFIGIGALRKLMLDITGTLWGPPGETLSSGILGQPLGPPALLDLTIFSCVMSHSVYGDPTPTPLNQAIDFGAAQLVPGNTPGHWTHLGPVQPDRAQLSSPAAQAPLIHDWLIQLGTDNGYQNIEQEVSRWTGITT